MKQERKAVATALFDAEEFLEAFGLVVSEEMSKVCLEFKDDYCIIATRTPYGVLINDIKVKMFGCSDVKGEYVFHYSDFESIIEAITKDLETYDYYDYSYALFIFNDEKNRIELVRAESSPLVIYYHKVR